MNNIAYTVLLLICLLGGGYAIATSLLTNNDSTKTFALSFGVALIAISLAALTMKISNKDTIEMKASLTKIIEDLSKIDDSVEKCYEQLKLQNERLKNIDEKLKTNQTQPKSLTLLSVLINKTNRKK